jgi:ankyrin repeat protein
MSLSQIRSASLESSSDNHSDSGAASALVQNGATALHMVAEHASSVEAAKLLVQAGADVNAVNKVTIRSVCKFLLTFL